MNFRDHINYVEEKCKKFIFSLSKSAKITWALKQEALETIHSGGILPLLHYGAPVWKNVMNKSCYKTKLIRIQRLINIRISKSYRTIANEAFWVINGLIPINIKLEGTGKYEIKKEKGIHCDREMEVKNWRNPAKHFKIIESRNIAHTSCKYTQTVARMTSE
jgi:hypothetical protein